MTVPVLGPLTLSGFAHKWYFLFLLVVLGLAGLYIIVQLSRHKRVLRFANMELLDSVSPNRPSRWRHLAAILLVVSLLLLTVGMAGPTRDVRIPRNRAVVMLIIDVSPSMRATDVSPSRLGAAEEAGKQFADELTPGINLGLIAFGGSAIVLVSPTTNREATKIAIDKLQVIERTAIGESIFTALQAIATVGAVIGGGDTPPPARIVLLSDGRKTCRPTPMPPRARSPRPAAPRSRVCRFRRSRSAHRDGSIDYHERAPCGARCRRHAEESRRTVRWHPLQRRQRRSAQRCLRHAAGAVRLRNHSR